MHANEYIMLGEAAKSAPRRASANCIWRWCRKGVLSRPGMVLPPGPREEGLKEVKISSWPSSRAWSASWGLFLRGRGASRRFR